MPTSSLVVAEDKTSHGLTSAGFADIKSENSKHNRGLKGGYPIGERTKQVKFKPERTNIKLKTYIGQRTLGSTNEDIKLSVVDEAISNISNITPGSQLRSLSYIAQSNKLSAVTCRSKATTSGSRSSALEQALSRPTNSSNVPEKEPPIAHLATLTNRYDHCQTYPAAKNYNSTDINRANEFATLISSSMSSQSLISSILATQVKMSGSSPNLLVNQSIPESSVILVSKSKVNPRPDSKASCGKTLGSDGLRSQSASSPTAGNAVNIRLMNMGKKLLDAAREGQTDRVRQLVVDSGAPFTSDWLGATALHIAAQHGHVEIAEILLRGGVNRDARTKLERTALHLAAQGGFLEIVDLLLVHGSNVNACDMLKMTPLHWAVERGHLDVVERLLSSGADVNAKNKFQLTPVDIAQRSISYEMLELFKDWTDCSTKGENLAVTPHSDFEYTSFNESHSMIDVDHRLTTSDPSATSRTSGPDMEEPCIDLVDLEWNALNQLNDVFSSNHEEVEYLMKIVEDLQKENRHLRQKVEQLSMPSP